VKRAKGRQSGAGISSNSGDPADKLMAWLNHGVNVGGAAYMQAPNYFDACARWHAELTPLQRDTVQIVQDCYADPHRDAAESIAASLPSAPK
jgi:hypothetical protein